MNKSHGLTMLGSGLIGLFYTMTLHGQRKRDRVKVVYSRDETRAKNFAKEWNIPKATTDLAQAINDADTDCVVIGLPNHLHEEAVTFVAQAGKAILCTKPLGRNAAEAKRMLDMETFYDGYVVNAIIDACYKSAATKLWEPVQLEDWRGERHSEKIIAQSQAYEGHALIKRERMPDGTTKYIFKDKATGEIRSVMK